MQLLQERREGGVRACSNLGECGHAVTLGKKRGGIRACSNIRKEKRRRNGIQKKKRDEEHAVTSGKNRVGVH